MLTKTHVLLFTFKEANFVCFFQVPQKKLSGFWLNFSLLLYSQKTLAIMRIFKSDPPWGGYPSCPR